MIKNEVLNRLVVTSQSSPFGLRMFSALKKLAHRSPDPTVVPSPSSAGVNTMNVALQRKFARGVNYNLKLILKGDRNTGKSCLLKRLQGGEFSEEYIPTDEIQVASIQWNYKATDDIVKVEVWDVVDKGKKRKKLDGLKLGTSTADVEDVLQPALDAEFVDVYKGTHGVVFLFDVTKMWTFEYIERELVKVPAHIPVLIMANFIDRGHHRVVTREQAKGLIEHLDRGEVSVGKEIAEIRYAESSMRNGFGLKFLHKFLNLPYLILQRESLLLQLEINAREIRATQDELDAFQESDDGQYEVFLNGLTNKRRTQAEKMAPAPTVDVVVGQPSNTFKELATPPKPRQPAETKSNLATPDPISSSLASPLPHQNGTPLPEKKVTPTSVAASLQSVPTKPQAQPKLGKLDVDNFVPDQSAIDNFFEDDMGSHGQGFSPNDDDDDESEAALNPMVSGFADELDLDDFKPVSVQSDALNDRSSSDDETVVKRNSSFNKNDTETKKSKSKVSKNLFDVPDLDVATQQFATITTESDDEKKNKKHKKKKSKKRSSKSPSRERDELEDFLNGSLEGNQPPDATVYEAL